MGKEKLKREQSEVQEGKCAMSGKELSKDTSLCDTHRSKPKCNGGTYDNKQNVTVVDPVEHMRHHGNLRVREADFEDLKNIVDDRNQLVKLHTKITNQLKALVRKTDQLSTLTKEQLEGSELQVKGWVSERSKLLKEWIDAHQEVRIISAMLSVRGVSFVTIAYVLTYIDITEPIRPSSLWGYAGYDKPGIERYTKGKSSGGCKALRTALYNMSCSMMKCGGAYREVYDRAKKSRENNLNKVMSRTTEGVLKEMCWKDTKACHKHGHALRVVAKTFLADLWYVWRTIEGLPTVELYVNAKLGHKRAVLKPEERGWVY